jgi:hypothetical protein
VELPQMHLDLSLILATLKATPCPFFFPNNTLFSPPFNMLLKVDFIKIIFLSKFYQNQNFIIETNYQIFSTKNLVIKIGFFVNLD